MDGSLGAELCFQVNHIRHHLRVRCCEATLRNLRDGSRGVVSGTIRGGRKMELRPGLWGVM